MTKENIIIAALRLFLMRGYKSVSLIDVANEAGITKGGIYHYFASKDDLLRVSLDFLFERFETNYRELFSERNTFQTILYLLIVERPTEKYFQECLRIERECILDYATFALEIMRMFPDIQQRIEQSNMLLCEALAKRIESAIKHGEVKSHFDAFALAAGIIALANGQNSLGSQFQSPAIRQKLFESVLKMVS